MAQRFKGDALELQFEAAGQLILDELGLQLDAFETGAYTAAPLGDVIFESDRAPLTNAIAQDIFREAFQEVFTSFEVAGTFESYIEVFKKIFGVGVGITFTIPGNGRLNIDLVADEVILEEIQGRRITAGDYVFDDLIDESNGTILGQLVKGFQTTYELNQMLFEMVPNGIYTLITLTFGEE